MVNKRKKLSAVPIRRRRKPKSPWTATLDHFMAIGSLHKKKHSKRSSLKPHTAMASGPSPSSNHKKSYLIVSVLLVLSVVVLLGISSSGWSKFKSLDESFPRIYTIEVVNEFPHDPHAFTQVSIRVSFPFVFFLIDSMD